ncbi:MAG: hypothetical protein SVK54_02275 [candidate division WOR-3 bacterium]|nr:hypothetical protein [candidate division WOR-3 bacterium]
MHSRNRSANSICKLTVIAFTVILVININSSYINFYDNDKVIYDNEHLSDIMKIAIPVTAASAALIIATNGDYRNYFASRWAKFTSPQHVSPDQAVDFHFRSWEDMKNQYTHCDRGVHLVYSYIPVIPATIPEAPITDQLDRPDLYRPFASIEYVCSSKIAAGMTGIYE